MGPQEPINTTISSTAWTAITLDGKTPCSSYMFQTRDGSDFKWARTAYPEFYFTFKDGAVPVINLPGNDTPKILFYAQSIEASAVIEVFILSN